MTSLCILGLALPLGGTGGHSHATGSASVEIGAKTDYTVQPGDSLWSIADAAPEVGLQTLQTSGPAV